MNPQKIAISAIDAAERKRPIDPVTVAAYATIAEERMAEGMSPIIEAFTVRPHEDIPDAFRLVTGGHRLAMLKEIGFKTLTVGVEVNIKEMSEAEALQSELYENLANAGLKQLDRALFLQEAWLVDRAKKGETRGRKLKIERLQEDKKSPKVGLFSNPRWSNEVAERVGMSRASIFDAVHIANGLIEAGVVDAVRGTMIENNQNELKQLVAIPAALRNSAVAAIKSGEAKKVSEARVVIGLDKRCTNNPQAAILADVIDLWGKATQQTRVEIMSALGLRKEIPDTKP